MNKKPWKIQLAHQVRWFHQILQFSVAKFQAYNIVNVLSLFAGEIFHPLLQSHFQSLLCVDIYYIHNSPSP